MTAVAHRSATPAAPAPVLVERCAPEQAALWDSYVERHAEGSFFHLFGWGAAVRAAYGYEPIYLAAWRGGEIVGVLPLIDVRSPLLGRALVSTGFTVGGGPLGDDDAVVALLAKEAQALGAARRVQYVEFRSDQSGLDGWIAKTGKYAGFKMTLPADEDLHLKAIPRRRRAEIRKALQAEKAGALHLRRENDPDRFYALYAKSVHGLGTPVFPKTFLDALFRAFGDRTTLLFADRKGAPAAGLLSFTFKKTVLPYYIGGLPCARGARAHEFLYWKLMRRAAARGFETFDFGRSKVGGGAYRFKKLWGVEPEPLVYHYKLICARAAPDVSATNPKFAQLSSLWKRLPLAAANRLGPVLARNFP